MKRLEPEIIDYYNREVVQMISDKLEYYAAYKNKKTGDVLKEWEQHGIAQTIFDNYWGYHTERIENAYMDIDSLLATGRHAW